MERLKVIGYIRVSTEEQSKDGVSLDVQREKIEKYAQLYDLELIEILQDAGASGKTLERRSVRQLMARLDSAEAGGMLVAKLDRLTRSVRDWSALIERDFGTGRGSPPPLLGRRPDRHPDGDRTADAQHGHDHRAMGAPRSSPSGRPMRWT